MQTRQRETARGISKRLGASCGRGGIYACTAACSFQQQARINGLVACCACDFVAGGLQMHEDTYPSKPVRSMNSRSEVLHGIQIQLKNPHVFCSNNDDDDRKQQAYHRATATESHSTTPTQRTSQVQQQRGLPRLSTLFAQDGVWRNLSSCGDGRKAGTCAPSGPLNVADVMTSITCAIAMDSPQS